MGSKMYVIVLLGAMMFMQGCNTLKGASVGIKEDWKSLQGVDDWMEETFW